MSSPSARPFTPLGLGAMLSGVFLWGCGVIIIKSTESPFLVVSFYRHAVAIPIMFIAWLLTSERKLNWSAASIGGALFAVHQVLHFSSLKYSTVAVVTILFSLQPILIGFFGGRVVGERASKRFFVGSAVAISGCVVLILASNSQPEATALGTLLATLNLVMWSAYYLATKRARATVGAVSWLLVMTTVSGAIIGVLALATRQPFFDADAREWTLLIALALGPGTLGHFLVTWAQPRIHIAASSGLQLGVPIIASIGAAIFLDEAFGAWHALGVAIALLGTAAAMRDLPPPLARESVETYGEVAT